MKRALFVLSIATAIGTAFGTYFYFAGSARNPFSIVSSMLFSGIIGSLMMLFIYQREFFLSRIKYEGLKMLIMILLLIIAALVGTEITRFIRDAILFQKEFKSLGEPYMYFLNIIIVLVTGLPMYQREVWKMHVDAKLQRQQFELLKLEQLKTLTELEMLRAKVNPHFLYNIHNTIAGLIHQQPDKAEQMVLLLSRFFRFTLTKNSSTYNTVQEEKEIAETYLQLQRLRFGSRMQVKLHIEPQFLQEKLPSFLLQPLVENAVKHSIEKIPGQGVVDVYVHKKEDTLVIRVADNGPPFPEDIHYGFGLQGILNKLNLLYKDAYSFTLKNNPHKYVQIELHGSFQN